MSFTSCSLSRALHSLHSQQRSPSGWPLNNQKEKGGLPASSSDAHKLHPHLRPYPPLACRR